jgi:hypothetical protein
MASLLGFVSFAAICAALVGVASRLVAKAPRVRLDEAHDAWEPPKADPLPYARQQYFFSSAERSFYEVVRRIVPDYTLFAKVRLADLVRVPKGTASWQSHFNRIQSKHVDFVVCDCDLAPLVVIELDDASHLQAARQARDSFVDEVLATVGLPIVHIRAQRGYVPDEVRQHLAPHLHLVSETRLEYDSRYMTRAAATASPKSGTPRIASRAC